MITSTQLYLVSYNSTCFVLWTSVGLLLLFSSDGGVFSTTGLNPSLLWTTIQPWISIAQSLAILECIHSITGIVRSPFMATCMQVCSRLHIIWIIWRLCPPSRQAFAFVTAAGAWSVAEFIRYAFYTINTITSVPYSLKWLRYSAFVVLYPIGILSEVKCICLSLRYLKQSESLRSYPFPMPNMLNFELDLYVIYIILLCCYVPGSIYLYGHMMSQRSKALLSKVREKQS